MLEQNNLPIWPEMKIVKSQNLHFVDINDTNLDACICTFINCDAQNLQEIEDLGKVFIAAPKMLEAILRFQREWVAVLPTPRQRANNYSIESQFEAAIENIFKP